MAQDVWDKPVNMRGLQHFKLRQDAYNESVYAGKGEVPDFDFATNAEINEYIFGETPAGVDEL